MRTMGTCAEFDRIRMLADVNNSMVGVAGKNDMLKNFVAHATKRPN